MQRVKVTATQVKAHELEPGELFSTAPQSYWNTALDRSSCGERVYIRTHIDAAFFADANDKVYRLTVEKDHD